MKVISRRGRQFFGDRWKSQDNAQVLVVSERRCTDAHTNTLLHFKYNLKKILRGIHRCFANNNLLLDVMLDITVALIFLCNMSSVSQLLSSTCKKKSKSSVVFDPIADGSESALCLTHVPLLITGSHAVYRLLRFWCLRRSPTPSPPFYLYTNWGMLIFEMHGCFQLIDIISETVDPLCRTTWWMGRWKGRMQVRAYPCCLACGCVSGHGWCHYPVFTNS